MIQHIICKFHEFVIFSTSVVLKPFCLCANKILSRLTHLSLTSLLWDIGKQHSPRCDAAERGVPSGAILFAKKNFIKK